MRGPCDGGDSCWCLHGQYAPLATPKPKTKKVKR
jgi:hypothetical protein